jgi:hypothetical protein
MGVTLEQQEIGRDKMRRAAQFSFKARKSTLKHVDLPALPEHHQLFANRRSDGVPSSHHSQLRRRKRAANSRTRFESGVTALPTKATSGATIALSDSQDQCSIDVSDRAAGSASTLDLVPSHNHVRSPVL